MLFSALAQKEIKIEDAINHVGDSVKICSMAYGGQYLENAKGSPTFLNIGAAYPKALLTIIISRQIRQKLTFIPEDFYRDKEVCVTGRIVLYKGKPQIILLSSKQLYYNQ